MTKIFGFVRVNDTIVGAVENGMKKAEERHYICVIEDGNRVVVGL